MIAFCKHYCKRHKTAVSSPFSPVHDQFLLSCKTLIGFVEIHRKTCLIHRKDMSMLLKFELKIEGLRVILKRSDVNKH